MAVSKEAEQALKALVQEYPELKTMLFGYALKKFRAKAKSKEGAECPICKRRSRIYSRTITRPMALSLARLYKAAPDGEFIHISKFMVDSGHRISALRFWGLVEGKKNPEKLDAHRGYWRITDAGIDYLYGDLLVSQKVLIYHNKIDGFEGDMVGIDHALGVKFSLEHFLKTGEDAVPVG